MNFINKTFRRGKSVKIIYVGVDKRVRIYYLVPKQKVVRVNKESFNLNDKDLFLSKGMPTYIFTHKHAEPINILDVPTTFMSPDDYDVAINAHVARDIYAATSASINLATVSMILSGLTLVGLIVIAVMGQDLLAEISTKLQTFNDLLANLGIGG